MNFIKTELPGVILVEPDVFGDNRGWFFESFSAKKYAEGGIAGDFVQDNHSFSEQKGTLRGLHYQAEPYAQAKLLRCTRGAILDVAVDIRTDSPFFGKYVAFELSAENFKQLYIPRGFAHGFITLTDNCEVQYKTDNFYDKASDRGIIWNDPEIGIDWGTDSPVLSEKDKNHPNLRSLI
ncbi:MAG: dTDP-4-dehydrorhamnose 3,5-epimerase [Ruminococcus sp.]|jgi:dTDP-4-dehydrorhamnose 3,5-epimerase|nr:dTDP-4-dehydrorhamnose 3,5-epimerase [Ruminococcus sp.]